jgi:hypothetical protein
MKKSADWLAWSLQFIAGLFVGAILALYITRRSWYAPTAASQHILMPIIGAALIGAGLASYFGDRLWFGASYSIIPPDEIRHSATSRTVSVVTIAVGGSMVLLSLLLNFHVI